MPSFKFGTRKVDPLHEKAVATKNIAENITGGGKFKPDKDGGLIRTKKDLEAFKQALPHCLKMGFFVSELGHLDILVNNAGVYTDNWETTLSINVMGVVNFCESTIPYMKSRQYGKIINIGSMSAHAARNLGGPYPTSKAAVLRYTKGLAYELRNDNINVNAVCPGAVWTSFQKGLQALSIEHDKTLIENDLYESFLQKYSAVIPMGRPQTTDDIGQTVKYLSSDSSKNITGQCIHVDGGAILRD